MLEIRESQHLIVVFHAAAKLDNLTLPLFVGQRITHTLDASILFVSDPSLEKGVSIGWFLGDSDRPFHRDLKEIIRHIADKLKVTNIITFGSSAGGFAAMLYAHMLPGSLAIAINPQTDLRSYYAAPVSHYLSSCWNATLENFSLACPIPMDLIALYKNEFPSHVLYVQNNRDGFHLENHFSPWREEFRSIERVRWGCLIEDWGSGHTPPPAVMQEAILQFALSAGGNWTSIYKDELVESSFRAWLSP